MTGADCIADACSKPQRPRGRYCSMHSARLARTGQLGHFRDLTFEQQIEAAVEKFPDGGCWVWGRGLSSEGYGVCRRPGSHAKLYTHRVVYELHCGPIADGLHIDHLCRNRACCNPDHLEPVTQAENNRRAAMVRTTCPQGHEYDRIEDGHRRCGTCRRDERARRRLAHQGWAA